MGRIRSLTIENYRSISDLVEITFPEDMPVVLVGENNAGKSNIVRALELVVGESWSGSHDPDDHEYFNRDKNNVPISISAQVDGVTHTDNYGHTRKISRLIWRCPAEGDRFLRMEFSGGGESTWVSNEIRNQCTCVVVGADRRLSYQLSYATKYTLLSKLMRRFHQSLTADSTRVGLLQDEFEKVKNLFLGVPEFKTFSDELASQVRELSGNLEYRLGIDFSAYDPSNFFHALRVQPHEGASVRTFGELGTGQEQLLALGFAYAYASAFHECGCFVLVIEEPEAHLHPLAQEWLGRKIRETARKGVQVLVTTHSPAFLDMLDLDGLALARKADKATFVAQITSVRLAKRCREMGAEKADPKSILTFYAAAATEEILAGFFARKIVLVEGPTESLALPVYLDRVGLSPAKEGIAVIPVHGVGNLAKWWRLFTAYEIPTYVVFDNDKTDDDIGTKRSDVLSALGVPKDRWESLLSTADWVVENRFSIFGLNFEKALSRYFEDDYPKLENEAQKEFGLGVRQSKPLVARYVAERLPLDDHSGGLALLKQFKDKIFALSEDTVREEELPF